MSPQDAMLHLKNSMHVNGGPGGAGGPVGGPGTPNDPYKDAPYAKGKHSYYYKFTLASYILSKCNVFY